MPDQLAYTELHAASTTYLGHQSGVGGHPRKGWRKGVKGFVCKGLGHTAGTLEHVKIGASGDEWFLGFYELLECEGNQENWLARL